MYQFREITLKNGPIERKTLVIDFDDSKMKIVGEFLMADAPLLRGQILEEIDQVLAGEKQRITLSGNRCALKITATTTIISDLFEEMYDIDVYPSYEIDTKKLRQFIVMWLQKLEEFHQDR